MLRHTIAGVGVCKLLPGRTEKQHSISADHNSNNTLSNRTHAASFQLWWPSSCTSKVSAPSDLLCHIRFWSGEGGRGRKDDRDLMIVYEPRSKTHTHTLL
jgi:hypothetical protein